MSSDSCQPWLHQHGMQVQEFRTVRQFPIALSYDARMFSRLKLNHILAATQIRNAQQSVLRTHPERREAGVRPAGDEAVDR